MKSPSHMPLLICMRSGRHCLSPPPRVTWADQGPGKVPYRMNGDASNACFSSARRYVFG